MENSDIGEAILLDVSRETIADLGNYLKLVEKWNDAINLVSKRSLSDGWSRHILDSAQLFRLAPKNASSWVDLGSGGGFPGIVIALLGRDSGRQFRLKLVESDRRKCAFLSEAVRLLALDVDIVSSRIEDISALNADVLSARALASLTDLLGAANQHLDPRGTCLFPKGAQARKEIDEARLNWSFDCETHPSMTDPNATILMIRNIKHV